VLLADFWAAGRARNPLDFVRWVVPIKARGRYTLCSAIHRAEGVRRVRRFLEVRLNLEFGEVARYGR
jgi:hypothetical protein